MFILKKEATFLLPIEYLDTADGGVKKRVTFDAKCKILSQTRLAEIQELVAKKNAELEKGITDGTKISDVQIANEILIGWEGIKDEDDKDIAFTSSTKELILDLPLMALTIMEKYLKVITEQKIKN